MTSSFTSQSYVIGTDGIIRASVDAVGTVLCTVKPILSQDRMTLRTIKYQWNDGPESIMTIATPLHQDWKAVYNCGVSHNNDYYALSHYLQHRLTSQDMVQFMEHHLDERLSIQDAMLALLCISRVAWAQLLRQLKQLLPEGAVAPAATTPYDCSHQHARVLLLPMMDSRCGRAGLPQAVVTTLSQYYSIIADLYQGTHDKHTVAVLHSDMVGYLWQPVPSQQ